MKIAFIDHSYHKRTQSNDFFVQKLSEKNTHFFWDDSWNGGPGVSERELENQNYDLIIFFQILWSAAKLKTLSCKRLLLVPMYDAVEGWSDAAWWPYRSYPILSFSKVLHDQLLRLGHASTYIQYFPEPGSYSEPTLLDSPIRRVFFWPRTERLSWSLIKTWLGHEQAWQVSLHKAGDPGQSIEQPSSEDEERYKIQRTEWFSSRAEYRAAVRAHDLYVAPRTCEGIGLSFLEALSDGVPVLAWNGPTMNEYIRHGENGFLLEPGQTLDGQKPDWEKMRRQAYESCVNGRLRFEKDWENFWSDLESGNLPNPKWTILGLKTQLANYAAYCWSQVKRGIKWLLVQK